MEGRRGKGGGLRRRVREREERGQMRGREGGGSRFTFLSWMTYDKYSNCSNLPTHKIIQYNRQTDRHAGKFYGF